MGIGTSASCRQGLLAARNLTSGARALTEVDDMVERVVRLEAAFDAATNCVKARIEKLTAGMKVMLAHMKGTPPADE